MSKKSPAVGYVFKKIRTTPKSKLMEMLADSPLTIRDLSLVNDLCTGLSISELSDKYYLTPSGVSKWKRNVCEKIHTFDMANLKR